jgi:hypothetical protein
MFEGGKVLSWEFTVLIIDRSLFSVLRVTPKIIMNVWKSYSLTMVQGLPGIELPIR